MRQKKGGELCKKEGGLFPEITSAAPNRIQNFARPELVLLRVDMLGLQVGWWQAGEEQGGKIGAPRGAHGKWGKIK